jgi:hypothetical protein
MRRLTEMKDLLIGDEEIVRACYKNVKKKEILDWTKYVTPRDREVAQAELDHLAELGIVYVKEKKTCRWCGNGDGQCMRCNGFGYIVECIPLSEYLKGDGK